MTRVLLAEASRNDRQLVHGALDAAGVEVEDVPDGWAALASAWTRPPDVVLLGVHLPEVDAHEVCRALRRTATTSAVPILLLAGAADAKVIHAGRACGVDGCLVTPFSAAELLSRLRSVLAAAARRARPATLAEGGA